MKTKQEIISISKGFLLGIVTIFAFSAIAWNGPVSTPPNYNTYTPINVSVTSQTKSGALWASSFLTEGGGYFGGNVGIGTANPAQKLSVVGTIESTSGGFKFPDNSTQTTAARTPTIQVFTSSGTWTKPTGVTKIKVRLVGGGGGGGGGNGSVPGTGGGGGGYCEKFIDVTAISSVAVTVGTGGAGGGLGVNGSAGVNTQFQASSNPLGTGGSGGKTGVTSGGGGGGAWNCDVGVGGGAGLHAYALVSTGELKPGLGGGSMFAPVGFMVNLGGGGGGGSPAGGGSPGGRGVVIVEEY